MGPDFPCTTDEDSCTRGAVCDPSVDFCSNINPGGGCGGLGELISSIHIEFLFYISSLIGNVLRKPDHVGVNRAAVGAFLGGYIILYGQVQSWTPQLVTGPLRQTPPNKMTEVLWGMVNCYPTLFATIVIYSSEAFTNYQANAMLAWTVIIIVSFAVIFAINSSIHSYLVVKYAAADKVAVSVGFYYMSNAVGRLLGTLGSGFLYTYTGGPAESYQGYYPGTDARLGFASCFLAGTISSVLAAIITVWIKDEDSGLKCGNWTIIEPMEEYQDSNQDRSKEPQVTINAIEDGVR